MIDFDEIKKFKTFLDSNLESNRNVSLQIDSRLVGTDSCFLSMRGEVHNSLKFLNQVFKKNCKFFVYQSDPESDELASPYKDKMSWIKVTNSIDFLHEFTRLISDKIKLKGGHVIGIAGSNGKTTTRQMLEHLVRGVEKNYITTQKNNNNHIGVPLTLLQANEQTRLAIIELGSNHPGEIEVLCRCSNPDYGVTTNIGETHLEFFGGLEEVFIEEGFLFHWIKDNSPQGVFLVNDDDEYLKDYQSRCAIRFGSNSDEYRFTIDKNSLRIDHAKKSFYISNGNITGEHNLFNLGVAFVLSREAYPGDEEVLLQRAQSFTPTFNRSEWKKLGDTKVFLDAYNANPSSMMASVKGFRSELISNSIESEPLYILGDMNELGALDRELHIKTAKNCSVLNLKNLVFIGQYRDYFKEGYEGRIRCYANVDEYLEVFRQEYQDYGHIFIKGSRSLQLERLIDIT